ncbi:MAG: hypothetical protein IKK70_03310 [Clostridia bacterium]|nr:hypothetical protein [Clostridia bacterium]
MKKILCITLIAFICLTGCSKEVDLDQLKGDILIGIRAAKIPTIKCETPEEYIGRGADAFGPDSVFQEPPFQAENETYGFIEQYNVSPRWLYEDYERLTGETIVDLTGEDSNGVLRIVFGKNSGEIYSLKRNIQKEGEEITQEEALDIAKSFIQNTLITDYNKKFDLSNYELITADNKESSPNYYYFYWFWKKNNVTFHDFSITVSEYGDVIKFDARPIFNTKLLKKIPDITEEQYCNIIHGILTDFYKQTEESFELDVQLNRSQRTASEYEILRIVRLFSPEIYAIEIDAKWTVSTPDGRSDTGQQHFYLPIADAE